MGAIRRMLDRYRRKVHISLLWPSYLQQALTIDAAKVAFFHRITYDPAWSNYYSEAEMWSFVNELNNGRIS